MAENLDELIEEMEAHELEGAEKLTPRDFAKLMKCAPQAIYYHLRTGRLESEVCACGRRVIDVERSKKALLEAKRKKTGSMVVTEDE